MRLKSIYVCIVAVLLVLARQPALSASQPVTLIVIHFEHCHDGDTCTGRTQDGLKIKIRLEGIDAPELESNFKGQRRPGQVFAREARERLESLVKGRSLPVKISAVDPYNRYVGLITNGKISVNEQLINEGYAFAYRGQKASYSFDWAMKAEATAKKNKRGLWRLSNPPQNPGAFRRSQNFKRTVSGETTGPHW